HDGGVVADAPGMYVVGLNVLRRRGSSFIHGAERDSEEIADHLACRSTKVDAPSALPFPDQSSEAS
ncbi:MAG: hypothetical protein ACI9N0_003497, partial [Ilumatobacter sp.]